MFNYNLKVQIRFVSSQGHSDKQENCKQGICYLEKISKYFDKLIRKQPGTNMNKAANLHFAVDSNNIDLAIELLNQGADPTHQHYTGDFTPLHVIVNDNFILELSGQLQKNSLINAFLSNQVDVNNVSNPKCINGVSHFHIACIFNHANAVEFFAIAKKPLHQPIDTDSSWLAGYTPLHCAIRYSSVEAAVILLRHGADIHIKNAEGETCLHLLIKRIMDMNDFITMGKRTFIVPYEEEMKRLKSLVKSVLKSNEQIFVDNTGLSALHAACILGNRPIVQGILKKGVNVNIPVKSESKYWPGWTPIHFAACFNIEIMVLLIESGADVTIKNSKGETALDLRAKRFHPVDIQLILSMMNEFNDIVLSDNCTILSDLLLAMGNCKKFSDFLQKLKDVNITIPLDSPIWPGYNLLHLSVLLNEKTQLSEDFEEKLDLPEIKDAVERHNGTEEEEALYCERLELCLEFGCSVSMKNANEQTPIHLAFGTLRGTAVKQLLSCSEDNIVDRHGLSNLHIACVVGHVHAIERCISGGADANSRVRVGFEWREKRYEKWHETRAPKSVNVNSTPLHLAVVFGHEDVVEYLLKNNGDVYAEDSMGFTPIHLTMYAHYPVGKDLARILFRATPNLRDSVSAVGLSHLHVAAWASDHEAVDRLLLNGAEIDRAIDAGVGKQFPFLDLWVGETALRMAKDDETVERLLAAGANVYAEDLRGVSALQRALSDVTSRHVSPFAQLVKQGKCEVESCGMTPLHAACASLDFEWAEELLKEGADVNARISDEDDERKDATPLHILLSHACMLNFNCRRLVDFVKLLVDNGADLTAECSGSTPLHLIYQRYLYETLNDIHWDGTDFFSLAADVMSKSLKSYDYNPTDYQGFSHFHLACLRNDVETATKFLHSGVDVNRSMNPLVRGSDGFSPLHFAMAYHCREVAYLLLERGADVNAEDAYGNKPLHVAMKTQFVDLPLMETVMSRGTDIHAKNLRGETVLCCLLKSDDLTFDDHLKTIELMMSHGCNLDQQDSKGIPLSEALSFCNLEGINALLQLGADVNVVDIENEFYLDEMIAADNNHDERERNVVKAFMCHLWKMRIIQLKLTDSNMRSLERVEGHFTLVRLLEQSCRDELTKAKETEIFQGLAVRDFLSELGAVAEYPRMGPGRRAIVDKFFKNTVDLRREFPEFCGLLAFQYKKIPPRMKLWQPAKEAIVLICKGELPDLCVEAILRYFTNSEMNLLVESLKDSI